jgi:MFS family permease
MFYGWVVLGAAFVVIMVGIGSMFSMGVFLVPLQEEFQWPRSQISVASLLNWLSFGLFSFLFGMLSDRIGTRRVVLLGGTLFGLGMLLSGLTRQIWHLYLSFGLLGGMGVGAMYVPLSATATRWFSRHRGLAVAIVSAGNGTGILAMAPLARYLISSFDWSTPSSWWACSAGRSFCRRRCWCTTRRGTWVMGSPTASAGRPTATPLPRRGWTAVRRMAATPPGARLFG